MNLKLNKMRHLFLLAFISIFSSATLSAQNFTYSSNCVGFKFEATNKVKAYYSWYVNEELKHGKQNSNFTSTSSATLFTYDFENAGTYTVRLDVNGTSYSQEIKVQDCLPLNFRHSPTCLDEQIDFQVFDIPKGVETYVWFVDGEAIPNSDSDAFTHVFNDAGTYKVQLEAQTAALKYFREEEIIVEDCTTRCLESVTFSRSKKYLLGAWVKKGSCEDLRTTYSSPNSYAVAEVEVFSTTTNQWSVLASFHPSGSSIDGWKKVEGIFTIPNSMDAQGKLRVSLRGYCLNGDDKVYFDDLRIQPFDASMKTYVYDSGSLKLKAELDENNYATFYDYDQQGDLIRIKKETERGVKTLTEFRQNIKIEER